MLTTTPFNQNLVHLNKGTLNDELTEHLAELVKAVRETGKAGSLTLTLKISMFNKANEDVVKISWLWPASCQRVNVLKPLCGLPPMAICCVMIRRRASPS